MDFGAAVAFALLSLFVTDVAPSRDCVKPYILGGITNIRGRGQRARYVCRRPYRIFGTPLSTCINGRWIPEPPKCGIDCPVTNIEMVNHSKMFVSNSVCLRGYEAVPFITAHCDQEISNKSFPICMAEACAETYTFCNSNDCNVFAARNLNELFVSCEPGFAPMGVDKIICDQTLNHGPFVGCRETSEQLSCDFEKASDPYCGWGLPKSESKGGSTFVWFRKWRGTVSDRREIIPDSDHTSEVKRRGGAFLYLPVQYLKMGDKVRLFSPVYDLKSNGSLSHCFTFWYHMKSRTVGELNIFVNNELHWTMAGAQGDEWIEGFVPLPSEPVSIIIEATRGYAADSYIGVDDFLITNSQEAGDHECFAQDTVNFDEPDSTLNSETMGPVTDLLETTPPTVNNLTSQIPPVTNAAVQKTTTEENSTSVRPTQDFSVSSHSLSSSTTPNLLVSSVNVSVTKNFVEISTSLSPVQEISASQNPVQEVSMITSGVSISQKSSQETSPVPARSEVTPTPSKPFEVTSVASSSSKIFTDGVTVSAVSSSEAVPASPSEKIIPWRTENPHRSSPVTEGTPSIPSARNIPWRTSDHSRPSPVTEGTSIPSEKNVPWKTSDHFRPSPVSDGTPFIPSEKNIPWKTSDHFRPSPVSDGTPLIPSEKNIPWKTSDHFRPSPVTEDPPSIPSEKNIPSRTSDHFRPSSVTEGTLSISSEKTIPLRTVNPFRHIPSLSYPITDSAQTVFASRSSVTTKLEPNNTSSIPNEHLTTESLSVFVSKASTLTIPASKDALPHSTVTAQPTQSPEKSPKTPGRNENEILPTRPLPDTLEGIHFNVHKVEIKATPSTTTKAGVVDVSKNGTETNGNDLASGSVSMDHGSDSDKENSIDHYDDISDTHSQFDDALDLGTVDESNNWDKVPASNPSAHPVNSGVKFSKTDTTALHDHNNRIEEEYPSKDQCNSANCVKDESNSQNSDSSESLSSNRSNTISEETQEGFETQGHQGLWNFPAKDSYMQGSQTSAAKVSPKLHLVVVTLTGIALILMIIGVIYVFRAIRTRVKKRQQSSILEDDISINLQLANSKEILNFSLLRPDRL